MRLERVSTGMGKVQILRKEHEAAEEYRKELKTSK
jgi:hypothetical protein